jgi:hypothetical protein
MREYDGSPSYEGQAASNDIKQKCLERAAFCGLSCSSIMIDGNLCSDSNKTFNYKLLLLLLLLLLLPGVISYIRSYKRSQPVNLHNVTVINTLSAVVITVSVDVQILPTGEEFGGRGGHNPIM